MFDIHMLKILYFFDFYIDQQLFYLEILHDDKKNSSTSPVFLFLAKWPLRMKRSLLLAKIFNRTSKFLTHLKIFYYIIIDINVWYPHLEDFYFYWFLHGSTTFLSRNPTRWQKNSSIHFSSFFIFGKVAFTNAKIISFSKIFIELLSSLLT